MTVTPEQERNWFAAHMFVVWPKITRRARRAYRANDDEMLQDCFREIRDVLVGWVRVLDDYTGERKLRPADTTAYKPYLSCSGSKQPPLKGSVRHPVHLQMSTGICPNPRCGRRLKLYANGLIARHKEGR